MDILLGSIYDYPQYYDIAFQPYTLTEANFIEVACRKYCRSQVDRLLEPGCGSGRLIMELAGRGYEMIGFDLNRRALSYLRRRLKRRRLHAETFEADMSDFRLRQPADAAYCTVNTFRDLLTEEGARSHLNCVAESLRPGGIYILGFRLLSPNGEKHAIRRWTEQRRDTEVTVALRALRPDLRRRVQQYRVDWLVRRGAQQCRLRHEFQYRTYTARQFRSLVGSVSSLELSDVYDSRYNIEQPFSINDEMTYSLIVLRKLLVRK